MALLAACRLQGRQLSMPRKHKRKSHWYVVQVRSGAESRMCSQIERACRAHDEVATTEQGRVGLRECFTPRFKTQRKWNGVWQDVELPLLPGYVIADAENPVQLAAAMRSVRDLSKLLAGGETYEYLDEDEHAWLERQTHKGDRVVPMSFARRVGDVVEVTEGPLKGHEGKIVKIDRQNSLAHLEFHAGQLTVRTKVGLAVLPGK